MVQGMPWPVWPRDFINGSIVRVEPEHHAVMLCSSSLDEEKSFFGESIPPVPAGHVRAHTKREIHFVQRIDERKSRYVSMFNTNLKMDKMPNMLMNFILKKICE
mmetsp:Transcript_12318/g.8969  ORF Transcript_12318/g.8969 Transcript_12318/m.8969 type:complete len:104 (-) Transcript_12318:180-491(-)